MTTNNPYQSPAYHEADALLQQQSQSEQVNVVDVLFSFQGRMSRFMYWTINLVGTFAYVVLAVAMLMSYGPESEMAGAIALILYIPFGVSMFAAQVKRWHDRNKSGWWWMVGMIPLIGPWWVLIECGFLEGTNGPNEYGESPNL